MPSVELEVLRRTRPGGAGDSKAAAGAAHPRPRAARRPRASCPRAHPRRRAIRACELVGTRRRAPKDGPLGSGPSQQRLTHRPMRWPRAGTPTPPQRAVGPRRTDRGHPSRGNPGRSSGVGPPSARSPPPDNCAKTLCVERVFGSVPITSTACGPPARAPRGGLGASMEGPPARPPESMPAHKRSTAHRARERGCRSAHRQPNSCLRALATLDGRFGGQGAPQDVGCILAHPPRARGNPRAPFDVSAEHGSPPARAGEPRTTPSRGSSRGAHPRAQDGTSPGRH